MMAEIVSTLLIAPFAFTFGELIPKNLYYRAPLWLLRRNIRFFVFFYRLFFPIGLPLMAVARVLQRLSRTGTERPGQILGRARLAQVLSQGQQEGLLLDVQGRLLEGLMHLAGQPVIHSVIPNSRVLGVPDNVSREDLLNFARRYGINSVAVCRPSAADSWYGYLRVVDVALTQEPLLALVRQMPVIPAVANKLEALLTLRSAAAVYGVVTSNERVVGLASDHGLSEQLFRAAAIDRWPPERLVRANTPRQDRMRLQAHAALDFRSHERIAPASSLLRGADDGEPGSVVPGRLPDVQLRIDRFESPDDVGTLVDPAVLPFGEQRFPHLDFAGAVEQGAVKPGQGGFEPARDSKGSVVTRTERHGRFRWGGDSASGGLVKMRRINRQRPRET